MAVAKLNESQVLVYLVEPSQAQARFIIERLSQVGMKQVRHFESAGDCLQAMGSQRPDAVMSSLYLPDMTGCELIEAIRNDERFLESAFILISSETRPQALERVRQGGACAILPKPFSKDQLLSAVRTTMDYLEFDDALHQSGLVPEKLEVLVVDDSLLSRRHIIHVLRNLGVIHFIEAETGAAAVPILSSTRVDLVVTDYHMPEMDGEQLVDYIRNESWQSDVPILMVTSEQDMGRLAAIERSGVSGICDKPFETETIRDLLERILIER